MASLSDFQKKKLGYIYHVFYDVNNDGKVDWEDFTCALEKIASLNKWDNANPKKAAGAQVSAGCVDRPEDLRR
jgi:hypothetical protein